jgi:DNA-binding Lrp family transcriptional regulator
VLEEGASRLGIRRIGDELGVSKDKVHRILKRIEKGDIEVTEDGKAIDHSKPKGIVALEEEISRKALRQLKKTVEEEIVKQASIEPTIEGGVAPEVPGEADPLEELLKKPWKIQCDQCRAIFEYNFTDMERYNLIEYGCVNIICPKCKDYPLGIPKEHKIFLKLSDVFRSYIINSGIIETGKS